MNAILRRPLGMRGALWAGLFLVACATSETPKPDEPETSGVEEAAAVSPDPPREVLDALIPGIEVGPGAERRPAEPRFDVMVDRAPARQFFMTLVEDTTHSLAIAPGVDGEISLALRNVTVEEVLATVQQAYGFGFERTPTGFLVLPSGLRTRVFRLDYLNLSRSGSSDTRVSSGQITDTLGGERNEIVSEPTRIGGDAGRSISGSRVQTTSERDLWNEIVTSVATIVGDENGRSVVGSPNAGLLVVRALPAELDKVAAYLRSAEASLNRVVILEAKILEVTLDDGFQAGINWAALATPRNDSILVGQTGGGSVGQTGFSESRGGEQDLGPPLSDLFLGTMTSAFGGVFSLALQFDKFSAFIELLERQGEVRTLSNPRISTVNNQKAVIKVGQDEFFVTDVSTTTVTGTATTSSPNVTLTPFFSGIALDVTPQISDDDEVILHVHPSVTEVVDQTKSFTIQDQEQELPLALSSIRESDSIVRATSGQIVVIGGLIQNSERDTTWGLPWLSEIPWLGRLFAQSSVVSRRTELVILLRPIVVGAEDWGSDLRETSKRLDAAYDDQRSKPSRELRLDGWLPPMPPSKR